jgi:hypothetical protein
MGGTEIMFCLDRITKLAITLGPAEKHQILSSAVALAGFSLLLVLYRRHTISPLHNYHIDITIKKKFRLTNAQLPFTTTDYFLVLYQFRYRLAAVPVCYQAEKLLRRRVQSYNVVFTRQTSKKL